MGNYIDLAYANTQMAKDPDVSTKWTALSDDNKNLAIDRSEQLIDYLSGSQWLGSKVSDSQSGEFPRDGMATQAQSYDTAWDNANDNIQAIVTAADGVIPDRIKSATVETMKSLSLFNDFDKFLKMQDANVTEFEVDVISFTFGTDKWEAPLPKTPWRLVRMLTVGYWQIGNNSGRLQRL